uniref:Uncharacterized protein n=1 Tax=Fagus sylvatica TaxID=28930 RepID=A0A2N9FMF5_FAGSY
MGSHDSLESSIKIPTIKFTQLFINGEFVDSISGQPWESHISRRAQVSGQAYWTDVLMSSLTNWEIMRPRAKQMPWSSRRKMKWEMKPPRLMKNGTREIQARSDPIYLLFGTARGAQQRLSPDLFNEFGWTVTGRVSRVDLPMPQRESMLVLEKPVSTLNTKRAAYAPIPVISAFVSTNSSVDQIPTKYPLSSVF